MRISLRCRWQCSDNTEICNKQEFVVTDTSVWILIRCQSEVYDVPGRVCSKRLDRLSDWWSIVVWSWWRARVMAAPGTRSPRPRLSRHNGDRNRISASPHSPGTKNTDSLSPTKNWTRYYWIVCVWLLAINFLVPGRWVALMIAFEYWIVLSGLLKWNTFLYLMHWPIATLLHYALHWITDQGLWRE